MMRKIPQRELVPLLAGLIDASKALGVGAHRDLARDRLRDCLRNQNCQTKYVWNQIGPRRCRYLASLGQPVPPEYLRRKPW